MNIFILTTLFFVSSAFSCPNGLVMNKTLNRCLTSDEVARVINRTSSCGSTDYECYRKNAEDELNNKAQVDKKYKNVNSTVAGEAVTNSVNAAAVAAPLMIVTSKIKGKVSGCSSISFGALVAGSAALVMGEHLANYNHKQRLKKIEEEWETKLNKSGSSDMNSEDKIKIGNDNQSESFEMLAQVEDSMVIAAKMKKHIFAATRAAFAASTAMAIFEMTTWGKEMAYCETKEKKLAEENKLKESTKEENESIKKLISNEDKKNSVQKKLEEVDIPSEQQKLEQMIEKNTKERKELTKDQTMSNEQIKKFKELQKEYEFLYDKLNELKHPLKKGDSSIDNNVPSSPKPNNDQKSPPTSSLKTNQFNFEKERSDNTIFKKITNHFKNFSNIVFMSFQKINLIQESFAGDKSLPWNNIGQKLYTPLGRSIISGVLAGWSWVMVEHAKKQIEVSTNRAKLLRNMKQQFDTTNTSINPCTSQDRNDPGRPNCYCYNSDYSRNGSRSTTGVCQKITVDTRVKASNYFGIDEGNFKGCISSNSQFDESCKCRQTNSCMKALKGSLNGLDAGSISMIKSNFQPLEKLTHGMMGSGSVDADGISNGATRMLAATEKLEEKVLTPAQKNEKKKLTTQFENDSIKAASGLPSPLDTSTGSNLPSNPLEASKMLQSEIDNASSVDSDGNQGHSGSGTVALPSGGGSETGDMGLGSGGSQEKLDFGLDTSASREAEVAEVMKNELDYGNNDVNTNSTSNLFEVLSNRYQKSGMKRLFESNE